MKLVLDLGVERQRHRRSPQWPAIRSIQGVALRDPLRCVDGRTSASECVHHLLVGVFGVAVGGGGDERYLDDRPFRYPRPDKNVEDRRAYVVLAPVMRHLNELELREIKAARYEIL